MRVLTCDEPRQWVAPVVFSPDGRWLVGFAEHLRPGQVMAWSLGGGSAWNLSRIGGVPVFGPGGGWLDITRDSSRYEVDLTTGRMVHVVGAGGVGLVAATPDGRVGVRSRPDYRSHVTRLGVCRAAGRDWKDRWQIEFPANPFEPGAFLSADAARVVWLYRRGPEERNQAEAGLRSYDAADGAFLGEWVGVLPAYIRRGAVGPAGVAVLYWARTLYVIRLDEPGPPLNRVNKSPKHFTDAAFSPDGRWLATTSNDALVTLWDTASWQVARQYEWKIGRLRSVAFSPDGALCAAGSDTGRVVVWDFDG